eukprot:COSAG06_NODE_2358_length_7012_cov_4.376826_1_plen_654_part_00
MSTTGLSVGLVERNPVVAMTGLDLEVGDALSSTSETDDDDDDEELVVLPAQLQKIGALLSTPAGGASALCKCAYVLLVGYPMWGLIVDSAGGPSTREKILNGNVVNAVSDLCIWGGMLLAGPAALHALRLAARPGGSLMRLGAGTAYVPRSVLLSLESSARKLRRGGTALVGVMFATMLLGVVVVGSSPELLVFAAFLAVWLAAIELWWYSLKVASALTAAPVHTTRRNARAEARRLRKSGEAMNPERWHSLIEVPVQTLVTETLRTLSDGWGTSVLLVGAGLVLFALGLWIFFVKVVGFYSVVATGGLLAAQVLVALLLAGFGVLPFLLAWEPAAASSNCARLEDDINDLYLADPAFVRALHVLKGVKALNKDQGLGFVAGGQVITKRTLWMLGTGIYSALAVFGPTLEGELGLTASLSGGAQHASCKFGWTVADDACFKLFGDGILGQPLSWADAEEACQGMGSQTHLASVTSEEQQRAVQHLAHNNDFVWIGLTDSAEEGSFVWSDDEPLEYSNWSPGDPNGDGNGVALRGARGSKWIDLPDKPCPYVCAKEATPTLASGGDMLGCAGGHWVMGTPYRQVDSLSYLPRTIVYGAFKQKVYDQITPLKIPLNETVTTPAECATLVQRDHRTATAAEYSNVGGEWCTAVFEA